MKLIIFVGPTRTSTTSIFRSLLESDYFSLSRIKDTNILLREDLTKDNISEEYLSVFDWDGSSVMVEASPLYFMHPDIVSKNLKLLASVDVDVALVFTLREPLERFYSLFNHVNTKRSIGKYSSFEDYKCRNIANSSAQQVTGDLDDFGLFESQYVKLLSKWLQYCPDVRRYVVFSEHVSEANNFDLFIRELLQSFNVDVDAKPFELLLENKHQAVKSERLHFLSLKINDKLETFFNSFPVFRNIARDLYYIINGSKPQSQLYDDELRNILYASIDEIDTVLNSYVVIGGTPAWLRPSKKY